MLTNYNNSRCLKIKVGYTVWMHIHIWAVFSYYNVHAVLSVTIATFCFRRDRPRQYWSAVCYERGWGVALW